MRFEEKFYDAMMENGRKIEEELNQEYDALDAEGKRLYHEEKQHQLEEFYRKMNEREEQIQRIPNCRKKEQFESLSSRAVEMARCASLNIVTETSEDGLCGSIKLEAELILFSSETLSDLRMEFVQIFLGADRVMMQTENNAVSILFLYNLFDLVPKRVPA